MVGTARDAGRGVSRDALTLLASMASNKKSRESGVMSEQEAEKAALKDNQDDSVGSVARHSDSSGDSVSAEGAQTQQPAEPNSSSFSKPVSPAPALHGGGSESTCLNRSKGFLAPSAPATSFASMASGPNLTASALSPKGASSWPASPSSGSGAGVGAQQTNTRERLKEKQKKYRHRQGQLVRELGELLPNKNPGSVRSLNETMRAAVKLVRSIVHPQTQNKAGTMLNDAAWAPDSAQRPGMPAAAAPVELGEGQLLNGHGAGAKRKQDDEEQLRKHGKQSGLASWHAGISTHRKLPLMEGLFSSRFTAVGVLDGAWTVLDANDALLQLLPPETRSAVRRAEGRGEAEEGGREGVAEEGREATLVEALEGGGAGERALEGAKAFFGGEGAGRGQVYRAELPLRGGGGSQADLIRVGREPQAAYLALLALPSAESAGGGSQSEGAGERGAGEPAACSAAEAQGKAAEHADKDAEGEEASARRHGGEAEAAESEEGRHGIGAGPAAGREPKEAVEALGVIRHDDEEPEVGAS